MSEIVIPPYPEKLRFSYSPWGLARDVIDIKSDGDRLIGLFGYWQGDRTPSIDEWMKFRQSFDACSVWNWKGRYVPADDICDGTPWSFWVRWGNKVKRSSGYLEVPESFDQLIEAVKVLINKQREVQNVSLYDD